MSETRLHTNSPTAGLNVPGYNIFRKDRSEGRGGGVIFYIRDHLKYKQITWSCVTNLECIGLTITISQQMTFTLIGIYRPPLALSGFYEELKAILNECNFKNEVVLLGDFNVNWNDKTNRKHLQFLANSFELTQLIKEPTRISSFSKTCIDLVFTNKAHRIQKIYNMVTGLSDHNMILFSRKLTKNRFTCLLGKQSEQLRIPKGEIQNLENALNDIIWSDHLTYDHVNENCHAFMTVIQDTMYHFMEKCKSKPRKKDHLPWVNSEIWALMKQRDHAPKMAIKTKNAHNRKIFTTIRNKVTKEIRNAKTHFFINAIRHARGNAKEVWTNIKKLTGNNFTNRSIRELQIDNNVTYDQNEIVTALNTYFIDSVRNLSLSSTSCL